MTFGENLQRLRKEKGLSQEEVAQRLFLTRQSVSKWENGGAEPGIENLIALAKLYHVTVDELVGNIPDQPQIVEEPKDRVDNWGAYSGLLAARVMMMGFLMLWSMDIYNGLDEIWYSYFDLCAMVVGIWFPSRIMWAIIVCVEVLQITFACITLISMGSVDAFMAIVIFAINIFLMHRPAIKVRFQAERF